MRSLCADTNLETSWTPVNELDSSLRFEHSDGSMRILWNNITTVQQASCHVLAIARVTFDHLLISLEAIHGNFVDTVRLVRSFCRADNRRIRHEREMDTRVRNEIRLEFVQINVEITWIAKRGRD